MTAVRPNVRLDVDSELLSRSLRSYERALTWQEWWAAVRPPVLFLGVLVAFVVVVSCL